MLEILPVTERDIVSGYSSKCKLPFSQALYVYVAKDGTKTIAGALFEVKSDYVQILYYDGDTEFFIFDAILRAGLNYAAENGIEYGYIPEEFRHKYNSVFINLNYPPVTKFDITNFFKKYKNCR